MRNVVAMAFLVSLVLIGIVYAQDDNNTARQESSSSNESSAKTIVYSARNSPADFLRKTLAEFLEDTAARVVSDAQSNLLLIHTTTESHERVLAILKELDRPPSTLRVQLHLLKAEGDALAEVDTASLSGRTDEVLKSIKSLESTGRVYVANRMELTALDSQKAMLQVGETVPVVSARNFSPGRGSSNNYSNLDVGTLFSVEARVSGESDIVLVVDFEKSEIVSPETDSDEESPVAKHSVSRLTHQTTSRIRDGDSSLVGTLVSQLPDGVSEAYLVLSASIQTPGNAKQTAAFRAFSRKRSSGVTNRSVNPGAEAGGLDRRYLQYYSKLLAKYDRNGDEVLNADERSKMSKDCSAADTDKDGLVTVKELTLWSIKR